MLKGATPLPHHIKIINDTVMGGCSHCRVQISNQNIHFRGEVSLANNGGFASMRGQWPWLNQTTSKESNAVRIKVQGDGKQYQFHLLTVDNHDGSAYVFDFETQADKICTIHMPLHAFSTRYRGRPIQKPPLQLNHVTEYGLLIGKQQTGEFQIVLKELSLTE